MQISSIPVKIPVIWATSVAAASYVRTVPQTSQIGITPGAASFADGFPPLTMQPLEAGGLPPDGRDMNGVLQNLTAWLQWVNAGAPVQYDSAFSTAIGGYPKGAILLSTNGVTRWRCTADNNATDPDGGSPANWVVDGAPVITVNGNGRCVTWPGGWSRQTGIASGVGTDGSVAVTFPKTFLTAPDLMSCGTSVHVTSPNMGSDDNVSLLSGSVSTTGMTVCNNKINGGAVVDVMWWAEGMVQWP